MTILLKTNESALCYLSYLKQFWNIVYEGIPPYLG